MSNDSRKDALRSSPLYPVLRRGYDAFRSLGATQEAWARVVMNRETRKLVRGLQPERLKALEISGEYWRNKEPFREYTSLHYPEFDICESATEETFDLIIAEQVFEHLLWPYRAGRNVYAMLNPGGHFLVSTPFLLRIHNEPVDCSRWTELGMRYFLAECGFNLERVQTASWGNRSCVRKNLGGWKKYRPSVHSLRNEKDFPVVVWTLAQK